jgi:hypothetical protein
VTRGGRRCEARATGRGCNEIGAAVTAGEAFGDYGGCGTDMGQAAGAAEQRAGAGEVAGGGGRGGRGGRGSG